MVLERTYQTQGSPERPMSWDDYESLITTEWENLLNREPPPAEPEIQVFFEQYPSIVPGAFSLLGNESGHYPWLCGLITQPPLPSYNKRVPDFMWLSLSSDTEQPLLIEIEAPSKRWFTKSGKQTENLTQALNQIADRVRLGVERAKVLARALKVHPGVIVFPGWELPTEAVA